MLTQMPVSSNHASEDIHEKRDIDEASFQADVGNIANPDLIGAETSRDSKRFTHGNSAVADDLVV